MRKQPLSVTHLPAILPANFDADVIFATYNLSAVKKRNLKACCYYILDVIYDMSQRREYRELYEQEGGYPLHASIMNQMMGKSYLEALAILEEQGVIMRSDSYQNNKISKLVTLTHPYMVADVKIREINHQTPLAKKLCQYKKEQSLQNEKNLKKIDYITKWFDATRIQVDVEELHVFLEFYRSNLSKQLTAHPTLKNKQKIASKINYRYNSMLGSVESLLRGNMNLSKTGKDHRLHSFLSNIKKEIRHLLTYDGESFVSIDVKSSQPYLLNYLLQPKNWENIVSLLSSSSLPINHIYLIHKYILMFGIFPESVDSKGLQSTKNIWESDFYLHIINKAAEEGKQNVFPDKQTTKKKIISIFFDTGKHMQQNEARKLFAAWFPNESAFIEKVHALSRKLIARQSKNKDAITNVLPVLLQRIESMLMLEHVCKVISVELPDAPLLPVHDCIHTTPRYAEKVRDIMERELTALVGVKPGITVDYYDKQGILNGLQSLAEEDWKEMIQQKSKKKVKSATKSQQATHIGLKAPLLRKIPKLGTHQVISTRYVEI